jgi:hypothetical protein
LIDGIYDLSAWDGFIFCFGTDTIRRISRWNRSNGVSVSGFGGGWSFGILVPPLFALTP